MCCLRKSIKIVLIYFILAISVSIKAQETPIETISNVLNKSSLLTHNIPSFLKSGQNYPVTITMRNLGLNTWMMKDDYRLMLYDLTDNMYQNHVWGIRSIALPYDVLPSEKVTFNFEIQAPQASGVYNCRWSMAKGNEFFGEITPMIVVNVSNEIAPANDDNNSQYIDQSVPATMNSGQKYKVSITMKNTGTNPWPSSLLAKSADYKLATYNDPADNIAYTDWGISPLSVTQSVEPGLSHTFEFEIVAPNPGTYNFQWMMMKGNNYFGEKSKPVTVNVIKKNIEASYNGSSFVDQSVPLVMTPNKEYKVTITMTNTGKTEWLKNRYHLTLVDPRMLPLSINPWRVGYIDLPENVMPGSTITFTFNITAPSESGTYLFQWSVMEDGNTFGESSPALQIAVK